MCGGNFLASQIDSRVYLSDIESSKNLPSHITHVISVMSEKPSLHPKIPEQNQLFIRAVDDENEDLLSRFGTCYDFIQNALKENSTNQVLIHCRAGRSRSATITMMYLMRTYHWNYDQAKQYLKAKRPIIAINKGFEKQLRKFSSLLEICQWKPCCSCSECQSTFGTNQHKKSIETTGKIKKSSSFAIHIQPVRLIPVFVPIVLMYLPPLARIIGPFGRF